MSIQTETRNEVGLLEARVAALEKRLAKRPDGDAINLVVFSGERDRLMAAFSIANSAAAVGMTVNMFFTFWATAALRNGKPQSSGKTILERLFGWMLPNGIRSTRLSNLEMAGLGRRLLLRKMGAHGMADVDEQLLMAADLGVQIQVCDMSMQLMGVRFEELIDYPGLKLCGGASLAELMSQSNTTLFI
ncbi:MAG: DsrE/DsrF/DrsH-like family protein [Planctomycetaceae bacterium]|nr:DsrE/DsrF/DrsH-like family protein [Planctomycetaceae bacterium]